MGESEDEGGDGSKSGSVNLKWVGEGEGGDMSFQVWQTRKWNG